jgi:hypothetical protein
MEELHKAGISATMDENKITVCRFQADPNPQLVPRIFLTPG